MAHLITKLVNKHPGPILVIGGGPSVTEDLARLSQDGVKPACVISANGHGFRQDTFKVDYIVCMDHQHSETKEFMQSALCDFGVPIITRHWWGDYRIPTRPINFRLNSGFSSVVIAAMMGGDPVLVTGIDCYLGATYFYNSDIKTCQSNVAWARFDRQIERVKRAVKGANIVPMSGPLTAHYPLYTTGKPVGEPPIITDMVDVKEYRARTTTAFHWVFADLPEGAEFPVSEAEGKHMIHNNKRYPIQVAGLDT